MSDMLYPTVISWMIFINLVLSFVCMILTEKHMHTTQCGNPVQMDIWLIIRGIVGGFTSVVCVWHFYNTDGLSNLLKYISKIMTAILILWGFVWEIVGCSILFDRCIYEDNVIKRMMLSTVIIDFVLISTSIFLCIKYLENSSSGYVEIL